MPILHWTRLRPPDADTTEFAWWWSANCLDVVVIRLGLDAVCAFLLPPLFVSIPDVPRGESRYSDGLWFFPKMRLLMHRVRSARRR